MTALVFFLRELTVLIGKNGDSMFLSDPDQIGPQCLRIFVYGDGVSLATLWCGRLGSYMTGSVGRPAAEKWLKAHPMVVHGPPDERYLCEVTA